MIGLTYKQAKLFNIIVRSLATSGQAPTFEEMRVAMGYRSYSPVQSLLNGLIDRNLIRRVAHRSRGIALVHPPYPYPAPGLVRRDAGGKLIESVPMLFIPARNIGPMNRKQIARAA